MSQEQDPSAILGSSTINTWKAMRYKKYIVYDRNKKIVIITSNKAIAKKYASVYDGAELGSTGLLRMK